MKETLVRSRGHEHDGDDRTFLSRARSGRGVMSGHCVIMLNIGTGSRSNMRE